MRISNLLLSTASVTTCCCAEEVTRHRQAVRQPMQAVHERSFLRFLIPMRVTAAGPMSAQLRGALMNQGFLIERLFGALEQVQLPSRPRMLLAQAFQRLLEGHCPQRRLRDMFEEADMESRKVLLDMLIDHSGAARDQSGMESELWQAVQCDPYHRLLAYELHAACTYYAAMMAVSSKPAEEAAVLVRALLSSDLRGDKLISTAMEMFASHPRDPATGKRLCEMPHGIEVLAREMLLVERDAFGVHRLDTRGDSRKLLHSIKLLDIVKTPVSAAILFDPIIEGDGNFLLERTPIYNGRWMRHRLSCGREDHRLDGSLPTCERVDDSDPMTGESIRIFVQYDQPICTRHNDKKGAPPHTEEFELAVEDTTRSYWAKYFMDR